MKTQNRQCVAIMGVLLLIAGCASCGGQHPQTAANEPTANTTQTEALQVVVKLTQPDPALSGNSLQASLWAYDPRLADVNATLIDQVEVLLTPSFTPSAAIKLRLGQQSDLDSQYRYYLTTYVLNGGQRLYVGEINATAGINRVLENHEPESVTLILRRIAP